jgi:Predicted membrane protein (DUF2232)
MPVGFLIGIGAGLVSALLMYSAGRGAPLLGTLLLLLTPLPSLLAGIGWGWMPAAAGAAVGALVMVVVASTSFAAGYFLALGLPVVLIAYLAYLNRPHPQAAAAVEWFPAGSLLAGVALYGGALPVLVLPMLGGSYDILRAPLSAFVHALVANAAADFGLAAASEQQTAALAEIALAALPAAFAAYWVAIFTLNLYLAGRVARASGRLGRDWPDLAALAYPRGFSLLLALALLASFAPGAMGIAGTSFTGGLLFAYLVAGLALMHFIARGRAPWLLWFVYTSLIVFGPYAALALTLGGLLDPIFNLKRRFGAPPPTTSTKT